MRDGTVTGPYYGAHIAVYMDTVLTPMLDNTLKPIDTMQTAYKSETYKSCSRSHSPQDHQALRCTYMCLSTQLKHTLQEDGLRCHGGEGGIVTTHILRL